MAGGPIATRSGHLRTLDEMIGSVPQRHWHKEWPLICEEAELEKTIAEQTAAPP